MKKIIGWVFFAVVILASSCNRGKINLRAMKHSLDVKVSKYFDALTNQNKFKMYMLEPKWEKQNILYSSYNPKLLQERRKKIFVSAFVRNIQYDLLHNKAVVIVHFMKEEILSKRGPVVLVPAFIEKQLWEYKNGEWGYVKTLKRISPELIK